MTIDVASPMSAVVYRSHGCVPSIMVTLAKHLDTNVRHLRVSHSVSPRVDLCFFANKASSVHFTSSAAMIKWIFLRTIVENVGDCV